MSRKIKNASEMGQSGGATTYSRHGSKHFSEIASKGRRTIEARDPEFYDRLQKAGNHARELKKQREIARLLGERFIESPTGSSSSRFFKILTGRG